MKKYQRILMFLTALMIPAIGVMYLYCQNAEYVTLSITLWFVLGLSLISAFGYGVLRLLFRSSASALFGCVAAWICFFAFSTNGGKLMRAVGNYYARGFIIFLAATAVLVLVTAFVFRKKKSDLVGQTGVFLCILCVFLLGYNGYRALSESISLSADDQDESVYQETFAISPDAASPNIYWLHMDGMLGFDTMRTYFPGASEEFRAELVKRGFMMNDDSYLIAKQHTYYALASLLSPTFYDRVLAEPLADHATAYNTNFSLAFQKNTLMRARVRAELRLALEQAGYTSQVIEEYDMFLPPVADRVYEISGDRARLFNTTDDPEASFYRLFGTCEVVKMLFHVGRSSYVFSILDKLNRIGPLDMGFSLEYPENRLENAQELIGNADAKQFAPMLEALYDAVRTPGPTVTFLINYMAHTPYVFDENGNTVPSKTTSDVENYAGQYKFAARVALQMIDMIYEVDPDAVIVLQADHGGLKEQNVTDAFGESAYDRFANQVASAIRVPEQYRNGDEAIALSNPLNIARYLVNNFVGENYAYLDGNSRAWAAD